MTLFDLFSKRRTFLPLYDKVWSAVEPHLSIASGPEDEVAHRLACFYYACVVYSVFYQTAVAAGMSTSSAFSTTRIQLAKYPFDAGLRDAVDAIFTADEESRERRFAEALQQTCSRIVAAIKAGEVEPVAVGTELAALQRNFTAQGFADEGPYPPWP